MRHLYAVEGEAQLRAYQASVSLLQPRLEEYLHFLRTRYEVRSLPRAIVWTSAEAATSLLGSIPVPAYTNDYRVVLTADLSAWRDIYLRQLEGLPDAPETPGDPGLLRNGAERKPSSRHPGPRAGPPQRAVSGRL